MSLLSSMIYTVPIKYELSGSYVCSISLIWVWQFLSASMDAAYLQNVTFYSFAWAESRFHASIICAFFRLPSQHASAKTVTVKNSGSATALFAMHADR